MDFFRKDWQDRGAFNVTPQPTRRQQTQPQPQQRGGGGGLGGFFGGIAESVASPFAYLINSSVVNPTKELSAQLTGNDEALRNARRESNIELGLGEEGTDLAGALGKWGGNVAQVGATFVPAGKAGSIASGLKSGAVSGGLFGAGEGLKEGQSLEDVLASAVEGGLYGGAFGGVAGGVGKGLNKAKGITDTASKSTERAGTSLLGDAWGIKTGTKIGGKNLAPQEAKSLQKFVIEEVGVPKTANASRVAERLFEFKDTIGRNIGDNLTAINRAVSNKEKNQLINNISNKVNKLAGQSADNPTITRIGEQLRGVNGVGELVDFRRSIDDQINWARNAASKDPVTEQLFKTVRNSIDDFTSKLSPELKRQNQLFSRADDALEATLSAAKSPRGINVPGMVTRVGGSPAQRVRSATGQLLSKSSQPRTPGNIASIIPSSAPALAGRGLAFNEIANAGQQQPEIQDLEGAILELSQSDGMGQAPVDQAGLNQQAQSPYSRENLLYDIQRDPENADKYISYFQTMDEIFNPQQEGLELNNTAIQSLTDLQTGLDNLGALEQRISESGANAPFLGGLRSLNPLDTEAKSLRAEIDRVKQVVGKALEGGVLRKEDEEKYARILPTIDDTDEVARRKIEAIRGDLQNKLNTFYANQQQFSGGSSLENALMAGQQQGGYY